VRSVAVPGLLALVAGCALGAAPRDLVNARAAYERASHGPAAELDPTDLHIAKRTLDAAEESFSDHGNTQDTRDDAYVSERRSEIAESRARFLEARPDPDPKAPPR